MRFPHALIAVVGIVTLGATAGCHSGAPGHRQGDGVIFPSLSGPVAPTIVPAMVPTPWTRYGSGGRARLAMLLTDTGSAWRGLAHGLAAIGVPFVITRDYRQALEHRVVLVYPTVSGATLSREALQALARHPRSGGTLIATQVLGGGLNEVFGFTDARPSRARSEVRFSPRALSAALLTDSRDRTIPLPRPGASSFGTYGYTAPVAQPLAFFDDGTAAITQREFGTSGSAYALGIDLGALLLVGYNNRDESMARSYVNGYEPALDVYLRVLRAIYQRGEPDAVTLDPVPHGRELTVLFTHDVDYHHSLANAIEYARLERSWGIGATYFIQTKYVRDWNDRAFFDSAAVRMLRALDSLGMEIASHTVAHSRAFNRLPLGSGREAYPNYWPRVTSATSVEGATILGEVRVSKFLLEHFTGATIESFRPGHLRNPVALPEALDAAGYRYSSSVTANSSLTHLPFQLDYERGPDAETRIFEFPVTVEDEAPPEMDRRLPEALALADRLAVYGGVCVVLIHPNVLAPKLEFERAFYAALKDRAWFGSVGEFGRFWTARNAASVDVERAGAQRVLTIVLPTRIAGLTLSVPRTWHLTRSLPASVGAAAGDGRVTLARAEHTVQLVFRVP